MGKNASWIIPNGNLLLNFLTTMLEVANFVKGLVGMLFKLFCFVAIIKGIVEAFIFVLCLMSSFILLQCCLLVLLRGLCLMWILVTIYCSLSANSPETEEEGMFIFKILKSKFFAFYVDVSMKTTKKRCKNMKVLV